MNTYRVALLPGDGIGPEIVKATVKVLTAIEDLFGTYKVDWQPGEAGFSVIEKYGTNLPSHTVEMLKTTVAALKGPMTTPPQDPTSQQSATIQMRKMFELYANVRPCFTLPGVPSLKPNIDLVIVRENTEGLYAGIEFDIGEAAVAIRIISKKGSERIARFAFQLAMQRKKHLTYVHKGNVLKLTDGVFNQAVRDVSKEFPQVKVNNYIVDAMAMALIRNPEDFDVVVTTNLFGDILSDEAAQLVGGVGVMSGANLGETWALFEPVHGSAPDISGKGIANPIATIFAGKRLLEYLGEKDAALSVEKAVIRVLKDGITLTPDLGGTAKTSEIADAIVAMVEL